MRKLLLLIIVLALVPLGVNAETIFSDDFEWGQDWNSSQGNALPQANGWGSVSAENRGGNFQACYVNSAGAKGSGRGFIQYWDQTTGYGSAQDIWLNLPSQRHAHPSDPAFVFPNEYYIGYWFRVDPDWDWGGISSFKIIKTNFASGDTWDINWVHPFAAYCGDGWCNVDANYWTGETNCGASIMTDEPVRKMFGCWNHVADGAWHSLVWHMNHSDGVVELFIDGSSALQMSPSAPAGAAFVSGIGTERWGFGGNITDGGGGKGEMWTAYDDFVIATTLSDVNVFLGVGAGDDTTPPSVTITTSSPQNVSTSIVQISFTASDNIGVTSRKWRIGSAPDSTHGTDCISPATVTGLSVGQNTVYIGAGDAAGNWGSDSITVNYSPVATTISIINSGIRGGGGVR